MRILNVAVTLATGFVSATALAQSSDVSLKPTEVVPGLTMLEGEGGFVADNPLADYHDDWNWAFITTERMTQALYRSNSSR